LWEQGIACHTEAVTGNKNANVDYLKSLQKLKKYLCFICRQSVVTIMAIEQAARGTAPR